MKRILPLILLCQLVIVDAIGQNAEQVEVGSYDRLRIGTGVEATLVEGKPGIINLEYSRRLDPEDIIIETSRGQLNIRLRSRSLFRDIPRDWYVKVEIPVERLEEITVNTGAIVDSRHKIVTRDIIIHASTGSELDLELEAQDIEIRATMGCEVKLHGSTKYFTANTSMGSVVDAFYLESEYAYIRANMGSEVNVYVTEEAEVSASMGADVDVRGSAYVSRRTFLGGSIN